MRTPKQQPAQSPTARRTFPGLKQRCHRRGGTSALPNWMPRGARLLRKELGPREQERGGGGPKTTVPSWLGCSHVIDGARLALTCSAGGCARLRGRLGRTPGGTRRKSRRRVERGARLEGALSIVLASLGVIRTSPQCLQSEGEPSAPRRAHPPTHPGACRGAGHPRLPGSPQHTNQSPGLHVQPEIVLLRYRY